MISANKSIKVIKLKNEFAVAILQGGIWNVVFKGTELQSQNVLDQYIKDYPFLEGRQVSELSGQAFFPKFQECFNEPYLIFSKGSVSSCIGHKSLIEVLRENASLF